MNWIHKTYHELFQDIQQQTLASRLSRRKSFENGIDAILSVCKESHTCEINIRIDCTPSITSFPKWHGVHISIQKILEYGEENAYYLTLRQLHSTKTDIFEYVVVDIVNRIQQLQFVSQSLQCMQLALQEWKIFFENKSDLLLSEQSIQGLFGELLFLQELITKKGTTTVVSWSGCNAEQHDFYLGKNAIEIKTTTQSAPYKVTIASEYQLDPKDVDGKLFLKVYPLRKSQSEGKTLVTLVDEIKQLLSIAPAMYDLFVQKLLKIGYSELVSSSYQKFGYKIRDDLTFIVSDAFPSIKRSQLPAGVSNVSYVLYVDACDRYQTKGQNVIDNNERSEDNAK